MSEPKRDVTALTFVRTWLLAAFIVSVLIGVIWAAQEGLARSYSDDPAIHCHAYYPFDIECKAASR